MAANVRPTARPLPLFVWTKRGLPPSAGPVADVQPPGLEIQIVRTGRDLLVVVLRRQPDLDVISLGGGKTHVAGAERNGAVRQLQPLEDLLGVCG